MTWIIIIKTTNNILLNKLDISILNNISIYSIATISIFKIANFGNYNIFFEMYNNYFDSYVYGSFAGLIMFLNYKGFGNIEITKFFLI